MGLAYQFLNYEMPRCCWTCSRHCSQRTATPRDNFCRPLGFPPGRRSFWTSGNTGRATGSHSSGWWRCCVIEQKGHTHSSKFYSFSREISLVQGLKAWELMVGFRASPQLMSAPISFWASFSTQVFFSLENESAKGTNTHLI